MEHSATGIPDLNFVLEMKGLEDVIGIIDPDWKMM